MSAKAVGLQQLIFPDNDTGGIMLPAVSSEIVGSAREGDSLVLHLADGRSLLIVDLYQFKDVIVLVRDELGGVLRLRISPDGDIWGVRRVSRGQLEEMFGVERALEDVEVEPPEETLAEGEKVEDDSAQEAGDPAAAETEDGDPSSSTLGQLTGLAAVMAAGFMASEGEESGEEEPVRHDNVGVARGVSQEQREKILDVMDSVLSPGGADARSQSWSHESRQSVARVEVYVNGETVAERLFYFDSDFNAIRVEFDDTLDPNGGSFQADRVVVYSVDSTGKHVTLYDDDADGIIDRAEHRFKAPDGTEVAQFDDEYDGTLFWPDREERAVVSRADGTVYEVDQDMDGTLDRTETRLVSSDRRMEEIWVDDLSDGTLDGRTDFKLVRHYSPLGYLVRTDVDYADDGIIDRKEYSDEGASGVDRVETYEYDAQRRPTRIEYDDDNDGTVDWTATIVYHPIAGETGYLRQSPSLQDIAVAHRSAAIAVHEDDDGTVDRTESYVYALRGFAVDADDDGTVDLTGAPLDEDGDGVFDRFDNDGNGIADRFGVGWLESVAYDDNGDGTIERKVSFEYDPDDEVAERPLYTYTDSHDDGTINSVRKYSYSQEGGANPARVEIDDTYDGTAFESDRAENRHYNALGQLVRSEFDDDDDDIADRIVRYAYGADGRQSEAWYDDDADGRYSRIEAYAYDDRGRIHSIRYDTDADGHSDRRITYDYDGRGRLYKIHEDVNNDGSIDSETTYNGRGQIIRIHYDRDNDGTYEQKESIGYDHGTGKVTGKIFNYDDNDDGGAVYERVVEEDYLAGVLSRRREWRDEDTDGTREQQSRTSFDGEARPSESWHASDINDDGTADRTEHGEYRNGSLAVRTIVDNYDGSPSDGSLNRETTLSYDAEGTVAASIEVRDRDGDGNWDWMSREEFDNGRIAVRHVDESYNGNPDQFAADRIEIHEYRQDGTEVIKYDEAGGRGFDRVEYRQYDDQGRLAVIRQDILSLDGNLDGSADQSETRAYHADGWHETSLFVFNDDNDASDERREKVVYDQQGREASHHYDGTYDGDGTADGALTEAADGTYDWSVAFGYDDTDRVVKRTFTYFDADGSAAVVEAYTYDAEGRVHRIDYDGIGDGAEGIGERRPMQWWGQDAETQLADGTPNRIERIVYDSETGRISGIVTRYDDDQDGTYDREAFQEFAQNSHVDYLRWDDGEGTAFDDGIWDRTETRHLLSGPEGQRAASIEFDLDGDGAKDEEWSYSYDSQFRLVKSVYEEFVDGTQAIQRNTMRFDAETGLRTSLVWDDRADGTDDYSWTYRYGRDGVLTRLVFVEYDSSGTSGALVETINFDEATGQNVERLVDIGSDGITDFRETFTYGNRGQQRGKLTESVLTEYGSDGRTVESVETRTYDLTERLVRSEQDHDLDGTMDVVVISDYDSITGHRTDTRQIDRDDDGTADYARRSTYDGEDRLTIEEFDADYDGTLANFRAERVVSTVYSEGLREESVDIDGNGTADQTRTYRYVFNYGTSDDDYDRETVEIDDTGDGAPDRIEMRSIDSSGRIWKVEYFDDGDVINPNDADRIEERVYSSDLDSFASSILYDDDADGSIERSETYAYGDEGRIGSVSYDTDHDGTAEYAEYREYGAAGMVSAKTYDSDGDGTGDRSESYRYDEFDRVSQKLFDDDLSQDGTYERTFHYRYGAGDRVFEILRDHDGNGSIDEIETYRYDSFGRASRVEYQRLETASAYRVDTFAYEGNSDRPADHFIAWNDAGDDAAEWHESRQYDSLGRLARSVYSDPSVAGASDRVVLYSYAGVERRITKVEVDLNEDLVRDWDARFIYADSEQVNRVVVERDVDRDGTADITETYSFSFSDSRVVVEYDGVSAETIAELLGGGTNSDGTLDGTADIVQTFTFGEIYYASPPDGPVPTTSPDSEVLDRISLLAGVDLRDVERIETNHIAGSVDSTIDRVDTYHYSTDDRLIRHDTDLENDGTVDIESHYAAGGYVEYAEHFIDLLSDGTVDRIDTRYFNSSGMPVRDDIDQDADGTIDQRRHFADNGTVDFIEFDINDDGAVDWSVRERRLLDAQGAVWGVRRDVGDNGTPDELHVFGEAGFRLALGSDIVPEIRHVSHIYLNGENSEGINPPTFLEIDDQLLLALSSEDGILDHRYDEFSPYKLAVWGGGRFTGDRVASDGVMMEGLQRDAAMDETVGGKFLTAYTGSNGSVLVDPDVAVWMRAGPNSVEYYRDLEFDNDGRVAMRMHDFVFANQVPDTQHSYVEKYFYDANGNNWLTGRDDDSDGDYQRLEFSGRVTHTLSAEMAEEFRGIESIFLGGTGPGTSVMLTISKDVLVELSKSASGAANSNYELKVEDGDSSDRLTLTGGFSRSSSDDVVVNVGGSDITVYRGYSSDSGTILVDPDISVTAS